MIDRIRTSTIYITIQENQIILKDFSLNDILHILLELECMAPFFLI
jgi:hypothetical protein